MSKKRDRSSQEKGPSRFTGDDQHGWAPDVDKTAEQKNPSAHRSFHPDEYAPGQEKGSSPSTARKKKSVEGTPVDSTGRSGEEHARKSRSEGTHKTGPKGTSRRPTGKKDSSAFSGVDPQEPGNENPRH